jgi:hypothetical protein
MTRLPWGRLIVFFILIFSLIAPFVEIPIVHIGLALAFTLLLHLLMRAIIATGIGLLIFMVVLFFANYIFPNAIVAFLMSIAITAVPFFQKVFPYVVCLVPPDEAWVITNPYKHEQGAEQLKYVPHTPRTNENEENQEDTMVGMDLTYSGYRKIRAQWEAQAGFYFLLPGEYPDKKVDLTRMISIENDYDEVYTLADKSVVLFRWRVFYSALPGRIVNFIRTRPIHIETEIRNRMRGFLQGLVGEYTKLDFDEHQRGLVRKKFEDKYGRANIIDKQEEDLGIWVSSLDVYDIDEPRSAQEAGAILNKIREFVEATKGAMSYDDARGIILAQRANNIDVAQIELPKGK